MTIWRPIASLCAACAILLAQPSFVVSQEQTPPAREAETPRAQVPKPDLSDLDTIRFLTDNDYPPFNYLDEEGALTGFNVDLARALCDELSVECDIRAVEWAELLPALESGETDAVIASVRATEQTLAKVDFTDPYYYTPARFVALKESKIKDTSPEGLAGKKIGVTAGTAHEAFLKDFYTASRIVPVDRAAKVQEALQEGKLDVMFGDGITLMFWLNGTASRNCCEFRGGAYSDSRYFGEGIGIAVNRGNRKLRAVLDYGLDRLRASGRLEELYLRYFPLSFF